VKSFKSINPSGYGINGFPLTRMCGRDYDKNLGR
jgi:hypothetical protein